MHSIKQRSTVLDTQVLSRSTPDRRHNKRSSVAFKGAVCWQLINEDSASWMLLHMLALEMDGKSWEMENATRNYLMMRNHGLLD